MLAYNLRAWRYRVKVCGLRDEMKFLCDVHIPKKLSKYLELRGFESEHVNHILDGCFTTDAAISLHVDKNDLILITKDRDFKNSHLLVGAPKKLIKVNLGNISNERLIELFDANLHSIDEAQRKFSLFLIEINHDGFTTLTTP